MSKVTVTFTDYGSIDIDESNIIDRISYGAGQGARSAKFFKKSKLAFATDIETDGDCWLTEYDQEHAWLRLA